MRCGAFFLAAALAASQTGTQRASAQAPKTLVFAVEWEPTRLDPATGALWVTHRVLTCMFESFTGQDLSVSNVSRPPLVPRLATSWDISRDRTVYTFHLRRSVKFHDGTPWNAEAAKFNFDRIMDPKSKYFYSVAGPVNSWWTADIKSYAVVDPETFRVTLKHPNIDFLYRLAQGSFGSSGMESPAAVEKWGNENVAVHPVGTGPFRFVQRVFNEKIVLERNPDYWDPKRVPKVDQLIFRPIVESAARELALLNGEADIIYLPPPDAIDFLKSKHFRIVSATVPSVYFMWLNFRAPELKDVRVRRAIAMAIDRRGLCKFLRRDTCIPAYGILNPNGPGYDPNFKEDAYDPVKARALLAAAGYGKGLKIRMDFTPSGTGFSSPDAEWIQNNLRQVGIDASIQIFETGAYVNQMLKGMRPGTDIMELGWGENDFHWLISIIPPSALPPHGLNAGFYDNPKIGQLLLRAEESRSEQEEVGYLRQIQKIIADDVAWIPYFSPLGIFAESPKVRGFVAAPQHWNDLAIVDKE